MALSSALCLTRGAHPEVESRCLRGSLLLPLAENVEDFLEFSREGTLEHPCLPGGKREGDGCRVEPLPPDGRERRIPASFSVELVTDNRKAEVREVDANLVHAPGDGEDVEKGVVGKPFPDTESRFRGLPDAVARNGPTERVARRSFEREFHRPLVFCDHAVHERKVLFPDASLLEFSFQGGKHLRCPCHEEDAGGIPIETVDNPRAQGIFPDGREIGVPRHERIGHRGVGMSGAGVYRDTCRLIDHNELWVLMEDAERKCGIWLNTWGSWRGKGIRADAYRLSCVQNTPGLYDPFFIHRGRTIADRALDHSTRRASRSAREEEDVKPLSIVLFRHDEHCLFLGCSHILRFLVRAERIELSTSTMSMWRSPTELRARSAPSEAWQI